jgi:O-Antigen ligase
MTRLPLRRLTRPRSAAPWIVAAVVLSLLLGAAVVGAPAVAALGVAGVATFAALVPRSLAMPVGGAFALLPWMVISDDLIPPLLRTFTTAAAAGLLLAVAGVPKVRNALVPIGAAIFVTVLLCQTVFAEGSEQIIQTCKDLVFPVMVLCVLSPRGRTVLMESRRLLVASGIAALTVHTMIIAAGLGAIGTYYGIGERLGFSPAIPHELALLGVIVAAAGVTAAQQTPAKVAAFAVGAIPATLTGVRSALLSIFLVLIILLVQSRFSPRAILAVLGVVIVAFASGAAGTVTARFDRQAGELSGGVESIGSGRGLIWTTAITRWGDGDPVAWAFGSGLRAVNEFEIDELGQEFVGHSDVIEILVDFGVLGLVGWMLLWLGLLTSDLQRLILVPIFVYALVNGAIEYVAPLSYGLAVAAALAPAPRELEPESARARGAPAPGTY